MNYRYFYNDTGTILGFSRFKRTCWTIGMVNSVGYVDSDQLVDIDTHRVDIESQTLVAIETE
jgi:hypothetical protein